jgi:hypothetical protein
MRIHRHVLLAISLLLPLAAAAEVYSWKDADGKVHYGARPPPGKQTDARKLAAPPPVDAEAARKAFNDKQLADREQQQKSQDESKKAQQQQEQNRLREENCRQARTTLSAIESGQIRYSVNAQGERVGLDGAAREAELARARKSVADWCSPPPKQ